LAPVVAISILSLSGEPPTWTQVVGGGLVICGVAWSEWRLLRSAPREATTQ
jgi:drug/metabolite transporter (DMT)-like permease